MKTKIAKCLINVICVILHLSSMVSGLFVGLILIIRAALAANNLRLIEIVAHVVLGIFLILIGIRLMAYLTYKRRPWMYFEPVNEYTCWPKSN